MEPLIKQSSVFVPIDISAKLLSDTVEKSVPPRFSERRGISISGVRDEYVQVDVTRSPLVTALNEKGISVSGRTTRARARVRGEVRPFGPSFSQSANGTITFSVSAKPEFKTNWKIDPNLTYKFTVPNMRTRLAGVFDISLRGKTTDALNNAAGKLRNKYRDNFPLNKNLKEAAEKLWSETHQLIEINSDLKTWAKIEPSSIFVMQPNFTKERMRAGLGVRIQNQIILSDTKPTLKIKDFPKVLEIVDEPGTDNLSFSLPVILDYSTINSEITQQLQTKNPEFTQKIAGKNLSLKITGGSLKPSGNSLFIETDIKAKYGGFFGKKISGKLYFTATPHLDKATNQLKFLEFDYHTDTNSFLANTASFLLEPIVKSKIQEKLSVDLSKLETDAIKTAQAEIANLETKIPEGITLDLNPTNISLSDIIVGSEYLQILLDVGGHINIKVDDNFFLPDE